MKREFGFFYLFSYKLINLFSDFFLVFLFTCFLYTCLYSAKIHPDAGSTSATFLKIGIGARAIAMGGAYCAVSDDVFGIYWNPAGILQLDKKQIGGMHSEWFQSIKSDYLGYVHPVRNCVSRRDISNSVHPNLSIGGSVSGLYMKKDLERRSGLNEAIPEEPLTDPEGKFNAYDASASAGFAKKIYRLIDVGIMLKFIKQQIDVEKANGVAMDIGGLVRSEKLKDTDEGISAGVSVMNIGPKIKFIEKGYNLPLNFKAGCAYRVFKGDLTLAFDINQPIDNYAKISFGCEYWIKKILALRGGYTYRLYGNELGDLSGISGGAGVKIKDFNLDYAFVPFGDLGNTHRVSISAKFGKPNAVNDFSAKSGPITFLPPITLPKDPPPKLEIESKIKNITLVPVIISASQRIYKAKVEFDDTDIVGMEFLTKRQDSEVIKIGIEKKETPPEEGVPFSGKPYLFFEIKHNLPPGEIMVPKIMFSVAKEISFNLYQMVSTGRDEKWELIEVQHAETLLEKESEPPLSDGRQAGNIFSAEPKLLTKFAIVIPK